MKKILYGTVFCDTSLVRAYGEVKLLCLAHMKYVSGLQKKNNH